MVGEIETRSDGQAGRGGARLPRPDRRRSSPVAGTASNANERLAGASTTAKAGVTIAISPGVPAIRQRGHGLTGLCGPLGSAAGAAPLLSWEQIVQGSAKAKSSEETLFPGAQQITPTIRLKINPRIARHAISARWSLSVAIRQPTDRPGVWSTRRPRRLIIQHRVCPARHAAGIPCRD